MPSTKAAGGRIFSGVFTQGRQGTTQGQEDFELSWYLFFQHNRLFALLPLGGVAPTSSLSEPESFEDWSLELLLSSSTDGLLSLLC